VNGRCTNGYGVRGLSSGWNKAGVFGENNQSHGIGVLGQSDSYCGVYGQSTSGSAVNGYSTSGTGVIGQKHQRYRYVRIGQFCGIWHKVR